MIRRLPPRDGDPAGSARAAPVPRRVNVAIELLCRKIGMTRIFNESGECIPVTVLEAGPNTVVQKKTPEKDGYAALQLGFADRRRTTLQQGPRSAISRRPVSRPSATCSECRVSARRAGRGCRDRRRRSRPTPSRPARRSTSIGTSRRSSGTAGHRQASQLRDQAKDPRYARGLPPTRRDRRGRVPRQA